MTTGANRVTQSTNELGREELEFLGPEWRLRVELGGSLDPYELLHLALRALPGR